MLKPAEPGEPDSERPVGELVQQLVDEGKAYAEAEIGLVKAQAQAKARAAALPAALIGAAFLVAQAAVLMLAFALFGALYLLIGAVLAGIVTALLFAAVAYLLVQQARKRLEELW
jgi:hypothetical protein